VLARAFFLREARRTTASVSPLIFEFKGGVALREYPHSPPHPITADQER
jgi:hypothetical protein